MFVMGLTDCAEEAAWLALSIANTFHGLRVYY